MYSAVPVIIYKVKIIEGVKEYQKDLGTNGREILGKKMPALSGQNH
jgi:hypothetical protein